MATTAERIFDGWVAQSQLQDDLCDLIQFETLGFDEYDCSLELHGVPAEARLPAEAQKFIHAAGFHKCYVNHLDKWETHYGFNPREPFKESKGWRVSYPGKRGEGEQDILVEEIVPTWPKNWFEIAYCRVVGKSQS